MIVLRTTQGGSQVNPEETEKPKTTLQNIFQKTFTRKRTGDKADYIRDKNIKSGYVYLSAAILVLVLYSIFFFFSNVVAYVKAPGQIAKANMQIEEYEEVILPSLEKTKELHKAAYDKEFNDIIEAVGTVFPIGIDKLGIIRKFETFATIVNSTNPPFEFTSISLGQPQLKDGYVVLPASTSIHSSLAGFNNFLDLVDQSGYIFVEGQEEEKVIRDDKIRLMSVSNISIRYRGIDEQTGRDDGVDFSVKLNIYSRPETATE